MNKAVAGLIAVSSVVAAQAIGGLRAPTPAQPKIAAWYARLRKPAFTPPGSVFGGAWTVFNALQAFAGYRLLSARPSVPRTVALAFCAANLVSVAGFSWVLFGRRRLDEATGVSLGMVATSAGSVAAAFKVDRTAAWALTPLVGWVLFASVLQEEVWRRNA